MLTDITIREKLDDIIDVFTKVYGAQHREIIKERLQNTIYIIYNNLEGVEAYIQFLKECKQKELAVKFLKQIGIDVSKQGENYAKPLNKEINSLVYEYLGDYTHMDLQYENIPQSKINGYSKIYKQILDEYDKFLKEISSYQEYVDSESKRKFGLQTYYRNLLYTQIEDILPNEIKTFLDRNNNSIMKKSMAFFGEDLEAQSNVDFFSNYYEEKLRDDSVNQEEKSNIYYYRIKYFEKMGVETLKKRDSFETDKLYYEYCMKQEKIRKLIPSPDILEKIIRKKNNITKEMQVEYICHSKDFMQNIKKTGDNLNNRKIMYKSHKDTIIALVGCHYKKKDLVCLFYTIIKEYRGILDFTLLHELGHAIETENTNIRKYRSGFDFINDNDQNPYNPETRKYERFNETIQDIIAKEARKILYEQGNYIIEPKKFSIENVNDINTSNILKKILMPFWKQYREEIIKYRIYGNKEEFFKVVGEDTFEELNDVVNKVDSLLQSNKQFIKGNISIEYEQQLERLKKIYNDMKILSINKQEELTIAKKINSNVSNNLDERI